MNSEDFLKLYEKALASQDWKVVDPLIAENACVTFSNGVAHKGKKAIEKVFQKNFDTIKSEKYEMRNVEWIIKEHNFAVYVFEYYWTGLINDQLMSGSGVGTSTITNVSGQWKLLTEHLDKK